MQSLIIALGLIVSFSVSAKEVSNCKNWCDNKSKVKICCDAIDASTAADAATMRAVPGAEPTVNPRVVPVTPRIINNSDKACSWGSDCPSGQECVRNVCEKTL